ncbi:uncharacterized protein LOC112450760 [Kryptolebias marmoratus]|uniref:uncharacterized protein LOC112450760 n=1 Tax=Kryptolebias marmoratus TaxID=37003 RepID=UPI000D52F558|nr:uncharacterized protein LOC112450760 [Kryptolebias marmoratus]
MDYLTWVLVNGLLGSVNFINNAFYIFCMVRPLHGEKIKQPLKLLLAFLICSTTTYQMSTFGAFFSEEKNENGKVAQISLLISVCCLSISLSSSVWLNFFYYTQIVPAQRALFVWIKKNIKPIIFCSMIFESIFSLLEFTVVLFDTNLIGFGFNETFSKYQTCHNISVTAFMQDPKDIYFILSCIQKLHFYLSFLVMMMSSGATVVYLCRNMRRMVANGQSLSCPRFGSQVRVTITGIIHGLLFLSLAIWREYAFISTWQSIFISPYIRATVINFYMSASTFSLGAGQAVFRQRLADVWTTAAQWYKALTVPPPDQGA